MSDEAVGHGPRRISSKTALATISLAVASLLLFSLLASAVVLGGGVPQAGASAPVRQHLGGDCWMFFGGAPAERHSECPGADFTDYDFGSEIDLSYGNFEGANFTTSYYSRKGGVIVMANMNHANLSKSTWSGVKFSRTHFVGANLTSADLLDAKLTDVDLSDADLSGADLRATDVSSVKWGNTICPDGTNSDNDGDTCANNL